MTNAFEIHRDSPAYPLDSGCDVPPQSVREASGLPAFAPRLTIFRLDRNSPKEASFSDLCLFKKTK